MVTKKDLENKIKTYEIVLKATIDKRIIEDARSWLGYYKLLYKVKTGKNYYEPNIR